MLGRLDTEWSEAGYLVRGLQRRGAWDGHVDSWVGEGRVQEGVGGGVPWRRVGKKAGKA